MNPRTSVVLIVLALAGCSKPVMNASDYAERECFTYASDRPRAYIYDTDGDSHFNPAWKKWYDTDYQPCIASAMKRFAAKGSK